MFKKIFPFILTIIISLLIFVAGFYFGTNYVNSINNPWTLRDFFTRSLHSMSVLHYLDTGATEEARQFLILEQDTDIIMINALAETGDKSSLETACRILNKIYKHRKDNSEKYSNYNYAGSEQKMTEIKLEVKNILNKWNSYSCDNLKLMQPNSSIVGTKLSH